MATSEFKSAFIGMITGTLAYISLENILWAGLVAVFTGACSYVGHSLMKRIDNKYFTKKKKS